MLVSADGVRAGNKNSPHQFTNHTPFNGLSNALLSAHAGSAALAAIMNKIRNNYAFRDRVVEQSKKGHISLEDRNAFPELIIREMEKLYGPISDWGDALRAHDQFSQAVMNYDADGIKFGAQSAIVMSGPSAVSNGLSDFVNEQLMASARQPISDRVDLFLTASIWRPKRRPTIAGRTTPRQNRIGLNWKRRELRKASTTTITRAT
ncbi:TcdA/TcdB catalytic glycosyltransferase domain-containing protein [Pseudomonas lini]